MRWAYGIASGKLSPIFEALAKSSSIDFIGVRHEATAAFMATAIGASSPELPLCLGETGPGGLNLMSGLGGAYANSIPVLAVTSSNHSALVRPDRDTFSTTDNVQVFAPLTKWNARVERVDAIPEIIRQAITIALSGRPGPVHIDEPADILSVRHDFVLSDFLMPPQSVPIFPPILPGVLKQACLALAAAKRPLIVSGGRMVRSSECQMFRDLSRKTGFPVILSQMGLGLLPSVDPQLIGQGGLLGGPAVLRALREADVILALGCRFSSWMWADPPYGWSTADEQFLIHVDIDEAAF